MAHQDPQARIDELEHALRVAHRRIEELNTRALQAEGAAEKASVESQLRVGFLEAGMKPDMVEFALADAMAKGQWKMHSNGQLVRMVDPHTADVTAQGDYVTPAMCAKSLKAKAPSFFPDQTKKPSTTTVSLASGVKNPWTREGWNLTDQGKIMAIDMREALRLAEEAGSPPYATSPPPPKTKPADEKISKATGQPIVSRATFY